MVSDWLQSNMGIGAIFLVGGLCIFADAVESMLARHGQPAWCRRLFGPSLATRLLEEIRRRPGSREELAERLDVDLDHLQDAIWVLTERRAIDGNTVYVGQCVQYQYRAVTS